jgi:hypothetical protein
MLACSHTERISAPSKARLLPFEQIHPHIRRIANLEKGDRVLSCNSLIVLGRIYPPAGEPNPMAEIVVSDGPANYFDNSTGGKVGQCDFWYCTKHSRYCDTQCPPKRWTCDGIADDPPANTSLERTRER